jgi:L-ascorbate metabolism protein UlaG (beta-lactamase superfamily)
LAADGDRSAVTVQAVPAVHEPADGDRDGSGHVTCETTGFVLTGDGLPTIYLSGDNASLEAVADIADRSGPIDVAVLFVGAARVPGRQNGRLLTWSSARAAAAAEVLRAKVVIPAQPTDGHTSPRASRTSNGRFPTRASPASLRWHHRARGSCRRRNDESALGQRG